MEIIAATHEDIIGVKVMMKMMIIMTTTEVITVNGMTTMMTTMMKMITIVLVKVMMGILHWMIIIVISTMATLLLHLIMHRNYVMRNSVQTGKLITVIIIVVITINNRWMQICNRFTILWCNQRKQKLYIDLVIVLVIAQNKTHRVILLAILRHPSWGEIVEVLLLPTKTTTITKKILIIIIITIMKYDHKELVEVKEEL